MATSNWPSAANTGVPAGATLTTVNGGLSVNTPGVVLSGLDIKGPVFINANNVTLINSKVTAGAADTWYVVKIAEGVTGTVIQNTTIDGMGTGPEGGKGIAGSGTFIANNISGVEDGIFLSGVKDTLIQDNYIHDLKATGSPHYDGIQLEGNVSNVVIRHNTVINDFGQTSAVMIDNYFGPISNIIVDNNILVGGGYTIYVDGQFSGGSITGVSITDNHMGQGQWGIANFNRTSPVYTGNVNDGASIADALNDGAGNGGAGNGQASLSIAALSADEAEGQSGSTPFTFTVTRSGDTSVASSAGWAVTGSGASAASASDFVGRVLPSGTVSFAAGETSKTITVNVAGDTAVEPDQGFTVTLSNPAAGTTIGTASTVGTIRNDDASQASLSIAALSADKAEGQSGSTPFTFTVTRSGDTSVASSAGWAVTGSGASAASASDFVGRVLPSGTVSFAAGETSKTITVNVAGDTAVEPDQGFTVTLSNPAAGTTIGTASTVGTIRNDDASQASLSIAALSADKAEGQSGSTPFTFTVTRSGDTSVASSAGWAVTGSGASAASASDFVGRVLPSGTVSFAAGETSKTITVNVAGDTAVEPDQGFTVTLSNPAAGTTIGTASTVGTIRNDDASQASLSIAALSADKAEGQSGSTPFTFTVTRSGDTSVASSAGWAVTGSGASAASASDFVGRVLPSGTVSFAAGETSKTITVNVAGDTAVEPDQGFTVTLSNPAAGTTIGTASTVGTIRNDDASQASLSIAALSADKAEGQSGSTPFTFTVTRSGDTSVASSAGWAVTGSGASAASASDFVGRVLPSGTVSFAAGETSKTITVNVAGDTAVEPDQGFTVTLSNPAAGTTIGTASTVGTIRNDDASQASLSIAALSADKAEGQSGSTPFTFTVTRSGDTSVASSAGWAVTGSGASAASASDFVGRVLPSGTVSFAAGETSKTITVNVAGDTAVEPDQGFTVTLSNPAAGTTIGTASTVGTIRNDDASQASLSIAALSADKAEGQSGSTPFTFTVTRSGDTSVASSAGWAVTGSGASAASASDFVGRVLPSGTVSFAAGETSKTITVNVAGDTAVEPDQGFTVTLSNPAAGTTIGTASTVGTIRNDDASQASLSIAALSADKAEGQSGSTPFTFTVTRSGDTSVASSAGWAVTGSGASAASASDFVGRVLPSGTVSFAAGETSKTITVNVAGDTAVEPDQGFTVTLSNPAAGTTIGTASAVGTIRNDDASQGTGGYPDANSTGVPDGVTLTASGDINVTTAGTVINALDVKGTIWVMAPNVTIQNCKITSTDWTSIWIKPGITGTIVKDCEISNVGSSPDGANGIVGAGTFLRNDIHDVENGFAISGPSTIQDNNVHDMNAPNVRAGTQWGGPHYDGIEINGGVSNVTIKHNTIINENGHTSAVMINNDFGPVSNINVDGNYLAGGGYTLYSDGSFSSTDKISGVQFTNNVLGEGYYGYYYFKGNSPTLTGNDEIGQAWQTPVSGGAAGADTLKGLAVDDTFSVNHIDDQVVEFANEGTDKVKSTITHTLAANVENLTLTGSGNINGTGNLLANVLTGNSGNNTLDGGANADHMAGGAGNDTYVVDNGGDVVVEANGQGTDTVLSSVSYGVANYIENLTLTGSGNINGTGNSLANVLTGNSGNNTLDGGANADHMAGGAGNDTYVVDNGGDVVVEANGQGTDTVLSSVSYGLANYIENLTLTGSGNINGTGNLLANVLTGNSGNNTLDGGANADHMAGGAGNDTYFVDNAADVVVEANGQGTDTVLSSVSYSLANYVENMTLTGSGNINGTGNSLANVLIGNSGNNTLNGVLGADKMTGGAGNDSFVFNTALGATNIDTITDFNVVNDTIRLDHSIFAAIWGTGTLTASQFVANASGTAADRSDHIIYETDTGNLFYDSNGDAAGGVTQFAQLKPGLALTNADFFVI